MINNKVMKMNLFKIMSNSKWLGAILMLCLTISLGSCTEEIDESNFAIKEELTISEYIGSDPDFSLIKTVFDNVKLGKTSDASSLTSVLSTRGNYTAFLPNNAAMQKYLAELGLATVEEMNPEQMELIANSCIIDNGDQSAYESADFPTPGSFTMPNLKNRIVTCRADDNGDFIIGGTSKVIKSDIELSNGMLHIVETVISPSNKMLPDLIAQAGNMRIMSHLLTATKWADAMMGEMDMVYENDEREESFILPGIEYNDFVYAQHRYYGYTAFIEPDSLYQEKWGITLNGGEENWDDVMSKVKAQCEKIYGATGNAAIDNDFTHPENAVNKFVAYHLVYGKMAYDRFVCHYSEYGYKYGDKTNPQTVTCPTNVWDYYTTMGEHPSLIKITQVGDESAVVENPTDHPIYLNRISVYNNSREGDYKEIGVKSKGILISPTNGEFDNSAVNGFYFPINDILVNDETNRNMLGSERIRFDVTTVLHELISNNIRRGEYTIMPNGYFDNIMNESQDCKLLYLFEGLSGAGGNWVDYQGDEFMVSGLYDFTMKLPPVPKDGTYEIRMGVSMNSLRGMCQIYMGEEPNKLLPVGLPFDMRDQAKADNPAIPWVIDGEDDQTNIENDKALRNQGYMKGPRYFTMGDGKGETTVRDKNGAIRRIVTVMDMKAGKSYYIRFKSALKKLDSQFFMDFFEYAPSNIFNGATPEDIW